METSEAETRPRGVERRRWPRHVVTDRTSVTVSVDGRDRTGEIIDISPGGVRLRLPDTIPAGAPVSLRHDVAGGFAGKCVWSSPAALGVKFREAGRRLEQMLKCVCVMLHPDRPAESADGGGARQRREPHA